MPVESSLPFAAEGLDQVRQRTCSTEVQCSPDLELLKEQGSPSWPWHCQQMGCSRVVPCEHNCGVSLTTQHQIMCHASMAPATLQPSSTEVAQFCKGSHSSEEVRTTSVPNKQPNVLVQLGRADT